MKFRTTGILLVVFVLLAGYVFLVEMKKQPAATPVDKSTWILTLASDDVQKLMVTDAGQTMTLARDAGEWYIGDVGGELADAGRVGMVVDSLVDLRAARVLTQTSESLAAFGLENPAMTVVVVLSGGQETLWIGAKNPQGSQYYVQRKGQTPIYLVYASTVDDLKLLVSEPPVQPTPTPGITPTS
jgi:hypothetical protein